MTTRLTAIFAAAGTVGLAGLLGANPWDLVSPVHDVGSPVASVAAQPATRYIVSAESYATARAAVVAVGGRITHELGIVEAVAATLTPAQLETLRADARLVLHEDGQARVMGYVG